MTPVRGDLKYSRTRDATVGEQKFFAKTLSSAGHYCFQRNTGEMLLQSERFGRGRQGHQTRHRLNDAQAEATRYVIGETGRSHFWNRQAACRQYQRGASECPVTGFQSEMIRARNI